MSKATKSKEPPPLTFSEQAALAFISCLMAFISASSPLPIIWTPYLRPPCGLPLLSLRSTFPTSSPWLSSKESGVLISSIRSALPLCSAGFVSFLGASTAGLLTPALGGEFFCCQDCWGPLRFGPSLIKLRKPVFRKSRFSSHLPPSLSKWDSEPLRGYRPMIQKKILLGLL